MKNICIWQNISNWGWGSNQFRTYMVALHFFNGRPPLLLFYCLEIYISSLPGRFYSSNPVFKLVWEIDDVRDPVQLHNPGDVRAVSPHRPGHRTTRVRQILSNLQGHLLDISPTELKFVRSLVLYVHITIKFIKHLNTFFLSLKNSMQFKFIIQKDGLTIYFSEEMMSILNLFPSKKCRFSREQLDLRHCSQKSMTTNC